ncbi:hypothetical protein PsorP6_006891 [Peronosclerospora sorghi]|uniref:Uncharacterized protein n=1 Tax=Peronosclerospora sorghi TaxID=230839 RepID=A0ACC0WAW2_9STRA|nr:hypothetical protein PsorP6_006891 [Peronosclerospora sorghi]
MLSAKLVWPRREGGKRYISRLSEFSTGEDSVFYQRRKYDGNDFRRILGHRSLGARGLVVQGRDQPSEAIRTSDEELLAGDEDMAPPSSSSSPGARDRTNKAKTYLCTTIDIQDTEKKTIHRLDAKRIRVETDWSTEASQELLRLRFQQLQRLFDDAQTVADVHEAWGVVASILNTKSEGGLDVDAVMCSNQLIKLGQQWQDGSTSSTSKLHLMMIECFCTSNGVPQQQPELHPPSPHSNYNKATLMEEAKAVNADILLTRNMTTVQAKVELMPPPSDPVSPAQAPASSSPESSSTSPNASLEAAHDITFSRPQSSFERALISLQSVSSTRPEAAVPCATFKEGKEEFPRQNKIMHALDKRSQLLHRLARSHQHLTNVTQQLMEALVNESALD